MCGFKTIICVQAFQSRSAQGPVLLGPFLSAARMDGAADKYGGATAFANDTPADGEEAGESLEDISATASAAVMLEVPIPQEDGSAVNIHLEAHLHPGGFGVAWEQVDDDRRAVIRMMAQSQMASMLHDTGRIAVYEAAINHAVARFVEENGRPPVVLDIGTGTGLLALMAARAGAAAVIACEMYGPMAEVASTVTEINTTDKTNALGQPMCAVHVLHGKSTQLEDIPRADMLVTEIFDSVLLGEGVLPTLRHAHAELLNSGALVIPQAAVLQAVLVSSPTANVFHDSTHCTVRDKLSLCRTDWAAQCGLRGPCLAIHTDKLKDLTALSAQFAIGSFDFADPDSLLPGASRTTVGITADGAVHGVLVTWTLMLDSTRTYRSAAGAEVWQDHWVQVICPLPAPITVTKGDKLVVTAHCDDSHVWFDVSSGDSKGGDETKGQDVEDSTDESMCTCGLHTLYNFERRWMLSDHVRTASFAAAIDSHLSRLVAAGKTTLEFADVGDGSFCGLLAATSGVRTAAGGQVRVFSMEAKVPSRVHWAALAEQYNLSTTLLVHPTLDAPEPLDVLMAEPFFHQLQNVPLWNALQYWLLCNVLSSSGFTGAGWASIPASASIVAAVVELNDLWKGYGPVGNVAGFDHTHFDQVTNEWADEPYAFPMWMYGHKLLSAPVKVWSVDFSSPLPAEAAGEDAEFRVSATVPVTANGTAHAVMLWTVYDLGGGQEWDTSPSKSPYCRQTLMFLPTFPKVAGGSDCVDVTLWFPWSHPRWHIDVEHASATGPATGE